MKVLVLQLARLGDIFQTWPTFRALERNGCEVHTIVRTRFAVALDGLSSVAKVHEFDTQAILTPFATEAGDSASSLREALGRMEALMSSLAEERYDKIINLSFSPLSSWIAFDLACRAKHQVEVVGYTRHADGYLAIPDDASAFFFGQVGVQATAGFDRVNRLPLPRLLATVAGVDLEPTDWRGPDKVIDFQWKLFEESGSEFVAVHIGASQEDKTLSAAAWADVVRGVTSRTGFRVLLLGVASEVEKANEVMKQLKFGATDAVISLVGQTTMRDVFEILKNARALVAGDSALLHIGSLLGTPVLNVSSKTVSHWETGPLSPGSRVLVYSGRGPATIAVVSELDHMLNGNGASAAQRTIEGPISEIVRSTGDERADFLWQVVAGIYLGETFPQAIDERLMRAAGQWAEINAVEKSQLDFLTSFYNSPQTAERAADPRLAAEATGPAMAILDQVDELTNLLVREEPRLAPIARWRSTEKLRWGPAPVLELIARSVELNRQLDLILGQWVAINQAVGESSERQAVDI